MPKASVIVPVYKVEEYLEKCVQSILAQTERDFELILVDDGSPDRCGALCDSLAQTDPRIRVIHQEHQGLGRARNTGIREARGDWLLPEETVEERIRRAKGRRERNYWVCVREMGRASSQSTRL